MNAHQSAPHVFRILIVDDHPIVRQGYTQLISKQPDLEICGEAESEAGAIEVVQETNPHLAIIDITLNEGDGIDLIKRLAGRKPAIKLLAASAHEESLFAHRALRAGAMGFINKKSAVEHLIKAIRCVLNGDIYLSERMSARVLKQISGRDATLQQDPIDRLTDRELEAFGLIGQGLATREIAQQMHLSPKTVDRYRENIKHKLHLSNANELVCYASIWVQRNH